MKSNMSHSRATTRFATICFGVLICTALGACFGPNTSDRVKELLSENASIAKLGWRVSEVRNVSGEILATVDLPPAFDRSYLVKEKMEHSVKGLCPDGRLDDFWKEVDDVDSFTIVVRASNGNVLATVDCLRSFNAVDWATNAPQ
jgi:hypothetical protein